jgi:hypothetical protein
MSRSHTCNVFYSYLTTLRTLYQLFFVAFHCVYDILSSHFTSPFSLDIRNGLVQKHLLAKNIVRRNYSIPRDPDNQPSRILPIPVHSTPSQLSHRVPRVRLRLRRGYSFARHCTSVRSGPRQPTKPSGTTSGDCTSPKEKKLSSLSAPSFPKSDAAAARAGEDPCT